MTDPEEPTDPAEWCAAWLVQLLNGECWQDCITAVYLDEDCPDEFHVRTIGGKRLCVRVEEE